MNTKLENVDSDKLTLTYSEAGNKKTVDFDYLFTHPQHKQNPIFQDNKLSKDGVLVNVNP